ncbi:hypothetical protein [Actinoplanes sp. NPDC051851]|uniref:hypothetical protein n=1 Tax=Actinoplanes sp. NPDC051851 TaxID=3154753 RepID=UPI00341CA2D0
MQQRRMQHRGRQNTTPDRPAREPRERRTTGTPAAPGAHDLTDPAAVLALQRSVGNANVGRMLTVQRMLQTPAGGQQQQQAGAAVGPPTPAEKQLVLDYQQNTTNPEMLALLAELVPYLDQVDLWHQETASASGATTQNLGPGPAGGPNRYRVNYPAAAVGDDRLAVLVHEVTHIAINEAYDSDMLNYPVPPVPAGVTIEDDSRAEENRQDARLAATPKADKEAFSAHVFRTTADLLERLPGAGFSPDRMKQIEEKLASHTASRPMKEYDAVLTHLLAWADLDDVPTTSEYYTRLTTAVTEAAAWRANGQVTPATTDADFDAELTRHTAAKAALNPAPPAPTTTAPAAQTRPGSRSPVIAFFRRLRRMFSRKKNGSART